MMCLGLNESLVLPLLLSNLSSTELCLMFLIEKQDNSFLYRSRNCSGFPIQLCDECKETFDTLNHFHHIYLKQTCNEFRNGLQRETVINTVTSYNSKEELVNVENTDDVKSTAIDLETMSLPKIPIECKDAFVDIDNIDVEEKDKPIKASEETGEKNIIKVKNKKNKLEKDFVHNCNECGEVFQIETTLERHIRRIHPKKFNCQFCSVGETKGLNYHQYKSHLVMSHLEEKENPEYLKIVKKEEEECKCSTCGALFTNAASLKCHVKKNHMQLLYSCTDCGKGYNSEQSLCNHKKRVHEDAPIPCEICGIILKNKTQHTQHIRKHPSEDGGKCDSCSKYFPTGNKLLAHKKLVHLKVKNAACPKCDRKFPTEHDVNQHIKIVHESARPFGCDKCDYKASSVYNLNIHRSKMHNINEKFNIENYVNFIKSRLHPSIGPDMIPLILALK